MSVANGTQVEGPVVDYAEFVVTLHLLKRRLEDQLAEKKMESAAITALELKVLSSALYYHLSALPRAGVNYDAGINQT